MTQISSYLIIDLNLFKCKTISKGKWNFRIQVAISVIWTFFLPHARKRDYRSTGVGFGGKTNFALQFGRTIGTLTFIPSFARRVRFFTFLIAYASVLLTWHVRWIYLPRILMERGRWISFCHPRINKLLYAGDLRLTYFFEPAIQSRFFPWIRCTLHKQSWKNYGNIFACSITYLITPLTYPT